MSLSIRLNGNNYTGFTSARVAKSIDVLTGAFSFASTANADNLFPIREGDKVEILADDILVMTGYVEEIGGVASPDEHSITINGRGVLQDMIDSSVKGEKEFTGSVTLTTIIRTILDDLGLTAVQIFDSVGDIEPFSEEDLTSAEVGQQVFDFIEKFARKRQILLNENEYGDLVLSRGTTEKAPFTLYHIVGGKNNNVKRSEFSLNFKDRYYEYLVQSNLNPIFQEETVTPEDASDQKGTVNDTKVRSTRFLEIKAEESQDSTDSRKRATWEANIRRARSKQYTATVFGHSYNGTILSPNSLIKVIDNFWKINAEMLVRSVELTYSIDEGSLTKILCAPKDAYTLEAEKALRDALASSDGDNFTDD